MLLFKEIKYIIVKNPVVFLLLLGGPIFLTLYFGGVYSNTYLNDIPIAVLDEDNSQTSRTLTEQFAQNERFYIKSFVQSRDELKASIDKKEVYMGLYIPDNFEKDLKELKCPDVMIMANGTNIIISNNAYAQAATIIRTVAAGAEISMLQGKGLLPQESKDIALIFNITDRMLYDPRLKYSIYLLFPFIAVFLQQVMVSGVGVSVLNNPYETARKWTAPKIFVKILSCSLFSLVSIYISVVVSGRIFDIPIRGNIYEAVIYSFIFILAISCPAVIIASLTKDRLKLYQISFMLSLPTFVTSSAVWPKEMMPKMLVRVIEILWPLINYDRPFAEMLIKGSSITNYMNNIIHLLIYTAVWFPIAVFIFKKRYKSMNDS